MTDIYEVEVNGIKTRMRLNDADAERMGAKKARTAKNKAVAAEQVGDKSLDDKSKADLLALAAEQDVEGRSSMNKAELVEALGG